MLFSSDQQNTFQQRRVSVNGQMSAFALLQKFLIETELVATASLDAAIHRNIEGITPKFAIIQNISCITGHNSSVDNIWHINNT